MDGLTLSKLPASVGLTSAHGEQERLSAPGGDHAAAGKQFEALIATLLVKQMRSSLNEGFFGSGPGADTFGGWLDKEIGDSLARSWDVDLAGMVKTNLDAKQARVDAALTYGPGGVQ